MIPLRTSSAPQGLGQFSGRTRPLDPSIGAAFAIAQATLQGGDPKVGTSFDYLRRIIGAPPLFGTPAQKNAPGKLSDLNPYLKIGTVVVENPIFTLLGLLAVPVLAYALGRHAAQKRA